MSITINGNKPVQNKIIQFEAKKALTNTSTSIPVIENKSNPKGNLLHVYFTGKTEKAKQPSTILGTASVQEKAAIQAFGKEYMDFLAKTKTNLGAAQEVVKMAKAAGYQPYVPEAPVKPGDKVYFVNNDRAVVLATIGNKPLTSGVKMVGSHLDSPHITLKAKPLVDSEGYCLFKTMMHGLGSKHYQWVNRHLALEGKVMTKDGREVNINIGNKPGDKTFIIPDLAPHVDKGDNKSKEFKAEEMNPIVAMNSDTAGKISDYVETILKEKYNISRDDLINAELNLVPAENPREIGFDEGLIGAYGHDDKSCVFASLKAELEQAKTPEHTTIAAFFGNEEIGSYNNYGAKSDFIKQAVGSLIESQKGSYNENDLRRTFKRSLALSADVSTAVDPIKPSHEEHSNACRLGHGLIMKLQGWRNSLPEATASVTRVLDRNNVKYQPFAYHQDMGGGATIGIYLATNLNMDVVDVGIPILSMHAPVEIADKGDVFHLYKGIKAFLDTPEVREVNYSV
jgi:aspartyl aminopeptidase